jgi:hypothetical protein
MSVVGDRELAISRFESLHHDFLTHTIIRKKAALLTLLMRLSHFDTNSDASSTMYIPMPIPPSNIVAVVHDKRL